MRLLGIISLLIFSAFVSLAQEGERSHAVVRDSSSAEFEHIAQQWVVAYNGTDANALAPLYTEDARYISGHVPGLVADGRDRVIANFQKGMKSGGHLDGLEILSVTQSCDLATVLCRYKANNSGQKVSGRTLLILRRMGGKWLIALHMTVV
jgi:ketosteroid isomerase-like protein